MKPIKVLFICMGNICRSPTAHGVFQAMVEKHKLGDKIQVDSAGTHSYHTGSAPDPRSQATALGRGFDLSRLRARRLDVSDFTEFDYLIAMDNSNMADMLSIKPMDATAKLHLMLEFSHQFEQDQVPDPYFGDDGFELVLDMVTDASSGLLEQLRASHKL